MHALYGMDVKPSLGSSLIIFPILDFWIFFVKNDSICISE